MQVSNKVAAASVIGAGLAVAATQAAAVSVTAPIAIPASAMQWILPIVAAIVPLLLQSFAPGLLPLWEWIKAKLPLPAELAEYQRVVAAKEIKPGCPVWHRQVRERAAEVFDKYHPEPETQQSAIVTGVNDATK